MNDWFVFSCLAHKVPISHGFTRPWKYSCSCNGGTFHFITKITGPVTPQPQKYNIYLNYKIFCLLSRAKICCAKSSLPEAKHLLKICPVHPRKQSSHSKHSPSSVVASDPPVFGLQVMFLNTTVHIRIFCLNYTSREVLHCGYSLWDNNDNNQSL